MTHMWCQRTTFRSCFSTFAICPRDLRYQAWWPLEETRQSEKTFPLFPFAPVFLCLGYLLLGGHQKAHCHLENLTWLYMGHFKVPRYDLILFLSLPTLQISRALENVLIPNVVLPSPWISWKMSLEDMTGMWSAVP